MSLCHQLLSLFSSHSGDWHKRFGLGRAGLILVKISGFMRCVWCPRFGHVPQVFCPLLNQTVTLLRWVTVSECLPNLGRQRTFLTKFVFLSFVFVGNVCVQCGGTRAAPRDCDDLASVGQRLWSSGRVQKYLPNCPEGAVLCSHLWQCHLCWCEVWGGCCVQAVRSLKEWRDAFAEFATAESNLSLSVSFWAGDLALFLGVLSSHTASWDLFESTTLGTHPGVRYWFAATLYWKVRNSWSANWNEAGSIRLPYRVNSAVHWWFRLFIGCPPLHDVTLPSVREENRKGTKQSISDVSHTSLLVELCPAVSLNL